MDTATVSDYCRNTRRLLSHGSPEERKALIRQWVGDIKLAPEALEVEITYRVPELFNNQLGAGACYINMHQWCWRRGSSGGAGWRRAGGTRVAVS